VNLPSKLFIYASLTFTLVYLYRFDFFRLPSIEEPAALAVSLPLLLLGFLFETVAWRCMLRSDGHDIPLREAIAASGASVLGKYIPGKLWMIVGRATLVAGYIGVPAARLSLVTLNAQVLALWVALIFGLAGIAVVGGLLQWALAWSAMFVVFSLLLFSRLAHRPIEGLISGRWPSLGERLPHVEPATALAVVPWLVLSWGAWAAGFHAMALGVLPVGAANSGFLGLGFPLASAIGVLALVTPGGLGVREGVIAGYLVLAGLTIEWSATVAIVSRVWFFTGELAFFAAGTLLGRATKPS
jgi:hypothetical protein